MTRNNKKPSNYFIFGKHPVIEALKNDKRQVKEVFVTANVLKALGDELKGYRYQVVENKVLDKLLQNPDANHQGIAIRVARLSGDSLKDIITSSGDTEQHKIIALDQITDPHNFGAILRTASAFGMDAVITTKDNAVQDNAIVAKTACGALEHLNICYVSNLSQSLDLLKENGYWVIGMDANSDVMVGKLSEYKKICLVMGAEGAGLRKLTKESCDLLVKIPIKTRVDSLNVSNAAAIAMYEITKV
ncbi:MAG: 23S rRNA (guanosine(2251)-2'-O)-methyltransferase RlmB [Alphaproteobacteria bacterium]|jgi:23S rRNA (guanosine2251-2'-O)-methyltransferase|nr:23S rRNA (guanosine(2251)-2'-O)-methyltransferase RlmB [Candidatus Jidaibacter sp.]